MAKWDYELANKLKSNNKKATEKATSDSTFFMGTIEQVYPLIISIEDGELMFEDAEDEIIKTLAFASRTYKKGASVICLPAEGLGAIVAVDLEG